MASAPAAHAVAAARFGPRSLWRMLTAPAGEFVRIRVTRNGLILHTHESVNTPAAVLAFSKVLRSLSCSYRTDKYSSFNGSSIGPHIVLLDLHAARLSQL